MEKPLITALPRPFIVRDGPHAGRYTVEVLVRPNLLVHDVIQRAIEAKGHRVQFARGALEVRTRKAPMEQLALPGQPAPLVLTPPPAQEPPPRAPAPEQLEHEDHPR